MPQVRNPAHSSRLEEPFRFLAQRDGRRPGPLPFPPRAGAGRLASGTADRAMHRREVVASLRCRTPAVILRPKPWPFSRQGSSHDDGVPKLSISTPIVPALAAFLHETSSAVELQGGGIVRPYLEGHFVSPRPGRPPDGSVEHRRPDAQTSPPDDHEHPDVSNPVGGDIDRNVADDSLTSHRGGIRNQYGRRNPRRESVEQATAGIAIERNLDDRSSGPLQRRPTSVRPVRRDPRRVPVG